MNIRPNTEPTSINLGTDGRVVTNLGPATLSYTDDFNSTAAIGTIAPGTAATLFGLSYFYVTGTTSATIYLSPANGSVQLSDGRTLHLGDNDPAVTSSAGDVWIDTAGATRVRDRNSSWVVNSGSIGPPGPPGAAGDVSISDAVRGQTDRFYREVGTILIPSNGTFTVRNDAFARPQNIDLVTADSAGITIKHDTIGARHLVGTPIADVDNNLRAVGITADTHVAADLKSTQITLTQSHALEDTLSNDGTGAAWTKEAAIGSPFTVTGLTNVSSNFTGYVSGLSGNAADFLMNEASGVTLDDNVGANDGTVVGSGTTYGVTGGVPSDGTDKAIATTGIATNELTFPTAGITQAAFSVLMRVKLPTNSTVPIRDATGGATPGYAIGTDGASPAHLTMYVSGVAYVSSTLWSTVADNNWHTIVLRKNGANASICVDGVQVHSTSAAGSTAISSPWHVGRNGTTTPYGVVTISRLTEFSRSLTDAEVLNAHQAALADGLLHITHSNVTSTKTSEITLTPMGTLRPVLIKSSVTSTGFDVKFLDSSGTQVLVADAQMVLGVSRSVQNVDVNPLALSVPIQVQREAAFSTSLPALSPVLWARLGESSGTVFNDEIGTNDGTKSATGVTLGATGMIYSDANTGVTLDGAQGKIGFSNPALTGSFSIVLSFKLTGVGSVGGHDYDTILGWGGASGTQRIMVSQPGQGFYIEAGGGILTTAAGTVPNNVAHLMIFTWDGTTQKIFLDGVDIGSSVTANVMLNKPFWLGSYSDPATNYTGKGDWDELALFDRALTLAEKQQIWADATNGQLLADRASDVQISFRGLFETDAPAAPTADDTNPVPTATALPANDIGGAACVNISLAPYRAAGNLDFGPSSPWCHRALPATQGARDAIQLNGLPGLPNATHANWKSHLCAMWGFDPTTGADTAPTQGNPSLYMRAAGEFIYIVPDNQPLRMPLDRDTTVSGWATQMNNYYTAQGGVPIPADAMPHFTGDRYAFWYQPSQGRWGTFYGFLPQSLEEAATTVELSSTPSNGGFFLEFDYQDPVNQARQTFFLQTPILFNDTAASFETKMNAAKTASGAAFGATRNFADSVACTGGPLNVAPIVCSFQLAQAGQPVTFRYTNNFLNAGGAIFTYHNSDPWTWVFLSAVTDTDIANATHHLPYMSVPDNGGTNVPATSAATHIDWMPMIIDWDEYNTAYNTGLANGWDAPGTDLGHIIAISIGNAGTGHVYPASGGDGTLTNTDGSKYMEGGLITFRTDASSAGIDPVMMPFFNTVKRYGMIAIDKTGGGMEPIFRNWLWPGSPRPFPGPSVFNFNSQQYTAYMRQMPYESIQIIDPAAVLAGW